MFHLGWFVGNGYSVQAWDRPWTGVDAQEWYTTSIYRDTALALQRACFDFMVFQDGLMVPDIYKGSSEADFRYAQEVPRSDPTAMIAALSQHTTDLGLISTISTSYYPPFMAARMLATLDQLTGGHAGGNLVTSSSTRAAQNFGLDAQIPHDERYLRALEWTDLVTQLWDSWEPDAVVMDEQTGVWADHTKVHRVDFEGRWHRSRGPLNTMPGPQGRPVISQAGASPAGREFGGRFADVVFYAPVGLERMRQYRDDIRRRAEEAGRDPDDCKVFFMIDPLVAETDDIAQRIRDHQRERRSSDRAIDEHLSMMSYYADMDLSQFDLDQPLPDLSGKINGQVSTMERYQQDGQGKTLRELASAHSAVSALEFVGSPETVARQMAEVVEEVGGDGFLFCSQITRKTISEITDGLVPELKRRGLTRTSYRGKTLRENLQEF